ncbi:MAG: hypothetical protein ACLR1V_14595 [Coprococcus sp.]
MALDRGHDTLPKLNYEESESLCEPVLRIGQKWVSPPRNVDGWRWIVGGGSRLFSGV